ncbi:hypothetical protein SAMN05444481_12431 [Flavobacterium frigidimaris]|nr:hypothetical protein SAMN05444481_12431 [Flavobacterium frigidimaris]
MYKTAKELVYYTIKTLEDILETNIILNPNKESRHFNGFLGNLK